MFCAHVRMGFDKNWPVQLVHALCLDLSTTMQTRHLQILQLYPSATGELDIQPDHRQAFSCMATSLSFIPRKVLFQRCGYCIWCFCSQHIRCDNLSVNIHDHQNCTNLSVTIYAWYQQICIYKLIWHQNVPIQLFLQLFLTCFAKWQVSQSRTLRPDNSIPSIIFRSTINLMYWGHTWPKRLCHNCISATPSQVVNFITRVAECGLALSPNATCPSSIYTALTDVGLSHRFLVYQYFKSVRVRISLKFKSIVKRTPHRKHRITCAGKN